MGPDLSDVNGISEPFLEGPDIPRRCWVCWESLEYINYCFRFLWHIFKHAVYFVAVLTDHGIEGVYDRFPVDFLIMLDSSASIGSENFAKAVQTLVVSLLFYCLQFWMIFYLQFIALFTDDAFI